MSTLSHLDLIRSLSYDQETGIFTWNIPTSKTAVGDQAGYLRKDGYRYIQINGKQCLAHRLAWFYVYKEWPPEDIDHINRNRADNRLENLRSSNRQLNAKNRSTYKNNTTGEAGVYYMTGKYKWRAIITIDGKAVSLGCFPCKYSATQARKRAEEKLGFY